VNWQVTLLCAVAALVFAFVRWFFTGSRTIAPFWVDALSLFAALLVLLTHSLLGINL
jgi:hypothetical protein